MARPALFVLAARRRYLRRFLSPRNQQNPKRSLRKMKGAEGPGRGGPRGCGGRELASDRRRPGGERARPWGVPRSRPRGVGAEPGGPLRAAHSRSPAPRRLPPLSAALPPRPRPAGGSSELGSFFKAPLKPGAPPKGRRFRTWTGAGWGGDRQPEHRLGPADPSPALARSASPEPARGTGGRGRRPQSGPGWGSGSCAPPPGGGAVGGGGRTKPYCGWGLAATEWLLFLR